MRRLGRHRDPARLDVNLTPLLDVVLQLITFFMMLIHFGGRIEGAVAAIRLPEAPAALPTGDLGLDRLTVGIDADGRLLRDEARLDADAAESFWQEAARSRQRAGAGPGPRGAELPTTVVLRADARARYGVVRRAMAAAERAGFARFTLVVLRAGGR